MLERAERQGDTPEHSNSAATLPTLPTLPTMSTHSGRLELTWTNKHLRLLAHEDENRKPPYEWVRPGDYRVSEARLLHEHETVGEVRSERSRAKDNLLIQGDALCALTSLLELPEFAREYAGKVRLVYIDPPFNTGQTFAQYDDGLEHSVWLTMLRDRLTQVRSLLARNGTVWLHLDDAEVHRARCVLDEVFGADNYVSTVIWEKADSPRMDAEYFSSRHDSILVYAKAKSALRTNRFEVEVPDHYNKIDEDGRRYYTKPLRAMGGQGDTREARPTMYFAMVAPDGADVFPIKDRVNKIDGAWRWGTDRVERDAHLIEWVDGRDGWNPYYRIYADTGKGRPPETIWSHGEVGSNRTSKAESKALAGDAFSTPKPERLLERVLHIASNPGDIVLDCFLGSGTTAAVAHKMGRRWVGVERAAETVASYALPRLTKVVNGEDAGGITESIGWGGGGGFRVLGVAPSMFEEDEGLVVLADWATNGKLGEACAAQLGYEFCEEPPFCGRKGRVRLAVVDGLVSTDVVRVLVEQLETGERVTVCGTSYDPEARSVLKELCSGSTLRKIPSSILSEYGNSRRSQLADALDWSDLDEAMTEGTEVKA